MAHETLVSLDLPGVDKLRSGKVREVFDLGETLLFVATDRLSAFDVILPDPIPSKGAVLNQISAFWFERIRLAKNHFVTADFAKFPAELQPFRAALAGRSMIVRRTKPLPIECVVRGYLAGSGWKDYQATGEVCGHQLPAGLRLASELPEPIFTPSTKNEAGHDLNIDWAQCCETIGKSLARKVRDLSLRIYLAGKEHAAKCGIIVADTKFEFGLAGEELLLIDECLTPDSSRFWPADSYVPGKEPAQFRQTICPRLSRDARLEQDRAGAVVAGGRNRENLGQVSRSFSPLDWTLPRLTVLFHRVKLLASALCPLRSPFFSSF